MAATANVIFCAATALLIWACVGLAVARHVAPLRGLAWPLAPAVGWAVHSAVVLPVFMLVGFSRIAVGVVVMGSLAASLFASIRGQAYREGSGGVPIWVWIGAAIVAAGPAAAILPKFIDGGVVLASPIFDHAKVAMIDEMARFGVPPVNPFFGESGAPERLAYYYLWHFAAAELAVLLGVSGWEADAAMTWFSAFASLMLMAALAVRLGGRSTAALLVLLLSATASFRILIDFIPGITSVIYEGTGLAGWLFQAAWVPQHIASATCVVLAIYLLPQLARPDGKALAAFVLVVVAGFESSTWVGGVTFAVAAAWIAMALLIGMPAADRMAFVGRCAIAAAAAAALASPFLYDQFITTAARGGGFPLLVSPFEVMSERIPNTLRRLLDLPAFWLIMLTIELSAAYIVGIAAIFHFRRAGNLDAERARLTRLFAHLTGASLVVAWLLVSTLAVNNDLGWRAVLPAAFALTIFAAAAVSEWVAARALRPLAVAAAAILLALPGGFDQLRWYMQPWPNPAAQAFAASSVMWEAVRRHTKPDERVGNNPRLFAEMTPWPVNISWALMANRRSCYAGADLALPYVPLSRGRLRFIDAQFDRVFAGDGEPEDVAELATRYNCRVIVVTARDGAWDRDPFAASQHYRLAEASAQGWRIYVIRELALASR
jgi:hypothetical protein